MHRINHRIREAVVVIVLAASVVCILAHPSPGQSRRRDKADKNPPASARDRIYEQQAKAWSAFYAGKYQQAAKEAGALLKAPKEWARVQAAHCQARCYWAGGKKQSRAKAKKIWTKLEKTSTLNANLQRLVIAKALMSEADKKDAQAIGLLEGVLKKAFPDTCTAEAAIELGRLYAKARRFKEARRAYDFAGHFLNYQVKREVSAAAAKPFVVAAKDAKDHLKYLEDAGREEFEEAEALRKKDKFTAAARLYRQIIKKYPGSNYAPRSELHLGHCLLGMKQGRRAVAHWKKFIAAAPAGPWRGQAYVGLIDLYLEHLLDLDEAGKYAELARNSLSTALRDKKSGKSWKAVAFDIYLRIGIVAFAQGKGPAAADAFAKARRYAPKDAAKGLVALITAAKSGKAVIPEDVCGEDANNKVALALSMGTIHNLACGFAHAETLFERVLKNEIRGGSAAQRSFATFGQAASLEGRKKLTEAKTAYLASAKNFPKGTWHDETLYRIASIVQHEAWEKFAKEPKDAKTSDKSKIRNPKSEIRNGKTAAERKKAAEEKAKRHKEYLKARGAALPYWIELTKRYPKSPRVEPAMYYVGVLLCEASHWNAAAERLVDFVKAYPKSRFAGDAYVRLIDISLERKFELVAARAYAAAAVEWAKNHGKGAAEADARDESRASLAILPPWALSKSLLPTPSDLRPVFYELHLRAGLVAYLDDKFDLAAQMLAAAGPLRPSNRITTNSDLRRVGLFFLKRTIVKKQSITPEGVLDEAKTEKQRTAMKLADMYRLGMRHDKTAEIYQRILDGDPLFKPVTPGLEAYCLMQLGRALVFDRDTRLESLEYLKRLYNPKYAKYPWTADGLLRLGVFTYNITQAPKKSMPHYKYLFTRYPEHPAAERALYFYYLNAVRIRDRKLAEKAGRTFLKKYPKSDWKDHVQSVLTNEIPKIK